ncbi:MAG TPA: twin-arginine translocation signal domain-containing protein [Gemmataceae bacterium]|nr:twin-arginine translocation signal domain-containing protein [Gemmataceae bacterium]
MSTDPHSDPPRTTRRDFLQATGLAACIGAALPSLTPAAEPTGKTDPLLPTIKLGPHEVTRLIIGGNPVYGYSHFNKLFSQHMVDWHTPEHVLALLKRCEEAGVNTWQNSYAERTLEDVERYRKDGGKMHWLLLGKPDWDKDPSRIDDAAKRKPIGISCHGALNERLFREKKFSVLTDLLKRIRDAGVLVGLSAHNPELIDFAEEKGWDIDYYMSCLYYLTRPKEEFKKILGTTLPLGEIYLPTDPERMFKTIRATKKPCLVYKVLAAGRRVGTKDEIKTCFKTALQNIKPTDAMIVGMYQKFGDQVGENAALVRDLCAEKGS